MHRAHTTRRRAFKILLQGLLRPPKSLKASLLVFAENQKQSVLFFWGVGRACAASPALRKPKIITVRFAVKTRSDVFGFSETLEGPVKFLESKKRMAGRQEVMFLPHGMTCVAISGPGFGRHRGQDPMCFF